LARNRRYETRPSEPRASGAHPESGRSGNIDTKFIAGAFGEEKLVINSRELATGQPRNILNKLHSFGAMSPLITDCAGVAFCCGVDFESSPHQSK